MEGLRLAPVVYTPEQQSLIDQFDALPFDQKVGDFWKNTHKGAYSGVKEAIKQHYLKAQNYTCVYCKQVIVVEHLGVWDAEHIIPKEYNPQFMFEPKNLCVSCKDCNNSKSNKSVLIKPSRTRRKFPDCAEDYSFCHPHYHEYDRHVRVVEVAGFYMPLTAEGVALIEMCGLLRFILRFGGYAAVEEKVARLVVDLGAKLMESQPGAEQVYLMMLIKTVVEKGLDVAASAALEKMEV